MEQKPYRALITGASRGIGRDIALALAPRCETIFLLARHQQDLERLRSDIACPRVVLLVGDLTDRVFVRQVADQITASGGINLLVNNAGVSEFVDFERQSADSISHLISMNLTAMILLTQALLPGLHKSSPAQIINLGSSFSYIGYPGFSVYCATKYGVRGFTQALGRELLGTGVSVRLFSPRATKTDINTEAVRAMNRDLGVHEDDPAEVARQFVRFCGETATERCVGFPEKLFARINQVLPGIVTGAIAKQLPRIRQAFSKS